MAGPPSFEAATTRIPPTAMRLKRHAPLLQSTLKRILLRPALSLQCNRHRFSSTSAAYPKDIAVLGGGISGLSSAHFVAEEFPDSRITIFESTKKGGGWLQSQRVEVPGGDVLFEYGPRTLRPGLNSHPTAQLVNTCTLQLNVPILTVADC